MLPTPLPALAWSGGPRRVGWRSGGIPQAWWGTVGPAPSDKTADVRSLQLRICPAPQPAAGGMGVSSGANTQLALPSASPSGPLRGGRAGSAFWNAARRVRPKRHPAGAAPAAVTAKAHRTPGGHRTPESYLSHRQRSPCAANPPGHGHGHGHGQCRDSRPARKWNSPMDRALTLPWAPQGRARPENGPALPGAAPRTGRWPMPIWVKVKDDLALTREDPKPCRAETQTRRRARGRQAEPQTRDPAASKGPGRQAEMSEVGSRQGGGGGGGACGRPLRPPGALWGLRGRGHPAHGEVPRTPGPSSPREWAGGLVESPILEMGLARGPHPCSPSARGTGILATQKSSPCRLAQLRAVHRGPGHTGELVGTSGYSLL